MHITSDVLRIALGACLLRKAYRYKTKLASGLHKEYNLLYPINRNLAIYFKLFS